MNLWALLGLLLILYSCVIVLITVKKPETIWNMAKVKFFIKVLGEKGTVIFFFCIAVITFVLGFYFMIMIR